jgi:hypothetical protein
MPRTKKPQSLRAKRIPMGFTFDVDVIQLVKRHRAVTGEFVGDYLARLVREDVERKKLSENS